MSSPRHDNLEIRAPKPIDTRMTVADIAARDAIAIEYRYVGLTTYVEAEAVEYWLETDINTWELKATGSGGGSGDGHVIQEEEYDGDSSIGSGSITTFPTRTNLRFGQPFNVVDNLDDDSSEVLDTLFASLVGDGVVTTAAVGGIPAGTLASDLKGNGITDLFNKIFFPIVLPTYTLPSMSVANSSSASVERGGTVSRNITSLFTQNDYGQGTNYELIYNAGVDDSDAGPFIGSGQPMGGQPHLLNKILPSIAGVVINVNAQVDFADAPAKDDNFGNPDPSPPGGATLNKAWTYTSRNAIWWGAYTTAEVPDAGGGVPTLVEALFKGGNFSSQQLDSGGQKTDILTPASGDNWMLAMCPPGTTVTFAKDEDNNIPFDMSASVVITVTDAQDQGGTEINYDVHYYFSPAGFGGAQNVTIKVD